MPQSCWPLLNIPLNFHLEDYSTTFTLPLIQQNNSSKILQSFMVWGSKSQNGKTVLPNLVLASENWLFSLDSDIASNKSLDKWVDAWSKFQLGFSLVRTLLTVLSKSNVNNMNKWSFLNNSSVSLGIDSSSLMIYP